MEDKIKRYVEYQLRFMRGEDIDEVKEEVTVNLIDRYLDLKEQGLDDQSAYVEAIKSMGNFSRDDRTEVPPIYQYKPSIPDYLLVASTILSIVGTLFIFIHLLTGIIITVISGATYWLTSWHLYSFSQYVRKEEKDIDKHNSLILKIVKHVKINIIFWTISFSYLSAAIIMKWIVAAYTANLNLADFTSVLQMNRFIGFYILLFMLFFFVFIIVFGKLYVKIINHFQLVTGLEVENDWFYHFFYQLSYTYVLPYSVSIYGIISHLLILFQSVELKETQDFGAGIITLTTSKPFIVIIFETLGDARLVLVSCLTLFALILSIILIIRRLMNKTQRTWPLVFSYLLFYLFVFVYMDVVEYLEIAENDYVEVQNKSGYIALLFGLFLFVLLIINRLIRKKQHPQTKQANNNTY